MGVDVSGTAKNKEDDDGEFDDHDGVVEIRGFPNSDHQECSDGQTNQDGRQIEEGPTLAPLAMAENKRGGTKGGRDVEAKVVKEFDGISRPAHRHRGGGKEVFQDEIPTNNPGQKLTQGGIGIGIGATRGGDHGSVFGVAEAGEKAADARDGEGEDESGPGVLSGGRAGQNKNSGANDGSDPEENELPGAQGLDEARLLFCLVLQVVDLLSSEEFWEKRHVNLAL